MQIHRKSLQFIHKLRLAYSTEDNGIAFDALMYYLLTTPTTTRPAADPGLETRVKDAMAFCASPEGEEFYHKVRGILDGGQKGKDGHANVYEFPREWSKAARHKTGEPASPKQFASRVLSNFNERISCPEE